MTDGTSIENRPAASRTAGGIDLFRVFGIQIAIDYSWLVIFALVLWSLSAGYFPHYYPGHSWSAYLGVGLISTFLFFVSVLTHELAHAVVGNRLGQEVKRITLYIFGGMAHLSGEPKTAGVEFKIAVVGPLTSLLLGAGFWLVSSALKSAGIEALWTSTFSYLAFINVALAVFNLLPGFPLDGGRLLRAYLWHKTGDLRAASSRAADWGGGIAVGLMILGALQIFAGALVGGLWLIFIGMFLRGAARASYYGVVVEQALGNTRVRDIMIEEPVSIDPETSISDAIEDYFLRYGYGGFPVGGNGRIDGLVSLAMVQRCPKEERAKQRVREIMRSDLEEISIEPDVTVSQAMQRMTDMDAGRLLVMQDGRLRGLITRAGVIRFIQLKTRLETEA
jgi:Zn-dependent protease/predicted transcriptional regulator